MCTSYPRRQGRGYGDPLKATGYPGERAGPVVASSTAGIELGDLVEQAGLRVDPEEQIVFTAAVRLLVANG